MLDKKKKEKRKKNLIILILVTIIVLLAPHVIRYFYFDNLFIGSQAYYHARIAETILTNNIPSEDVLGFGGIPYSFNPYHLILAATSYFLGITLSSIFLPFIFGLLSIFSFFLILDKLKVKLITNTITTLILILSPSFLYTFTLSHQYPLFIFMNLLAFYFLIIKETKKTRFIISIILFSLNATFGLFEVLIIILLLISYYVIKKDKRIFIILLLMAIASSIYYIDISTLNIFENTNFIEKSFIKDLLTDIGAVTGLGIFNLLLALIGLYLKWKDKHTYSFIYVIIAILFFSYYYLGKPVFIYLNFILVIFEGIALYKLITMKWQLNLIRNLTITILIFGLLFSSISFIMRMSVSFPDENVKESLSLLKSEHGQVVLSHYKNGFWIEYFAGKKTVMDENFYNAPSPNERFSDSNFIFMSYDLEATKKKIKKYNINYIFITPEMKKGLVWNKEKQGLLFLLRNSETFKNIYSKNDFEVWEVITK